jgi:hypothetical protein
MAMGLRYGFGLLCHTAKKWIFLSLDVNIKDKWGSTIWSYLDYTKDDTYKVIELLLDKGANINATDVSGCTPLMHASWSNSPQVAILLIERGAKLLIYDKYQKNAMAYTKYNDRLGRSQENAVADLLRNADQIRQEYLAKTQKEGPITAKRNTQTAIITPVSLTKSDIHRLPSMRAKTNRNAYAIVIGVEQYRQSLPHADFAAADARIVTEYLTKVMGYPAENVVTLLNDRALQSDMAKYFEKWLLNKVEKGATVFVYYSGHGAPNPSTGDAYLVPYDGDPSFISQTGYSLKRMYEALGKLPAKEIIVALDSCFSGAGGRSVLAKGARPLVITMSDIAIPKKLTVLSASSGSQISSTYDEKGHGLFTYFLLKGIKDEDIVKQDGSIAINDLFSYLKPQVERIARNKYNNEQTPQLFGTRK